MSQGPLCPNLSQKVQKEVSQIANRNFSPVILLGGLSVNLNHLIIIQNITRDPNGTYIIMKVKIETEIYTLVNVYAPNADDLTYFELLTNQIDKIVPCNIILGGDLNTIMDPIKDIKGGAQNYHQKVTQFLNNYCELAQLVDIWRIRHDNQFRYTWCKAKPYVLMERIDFFLISFHLQQMISLTEILPAFNSDHAIPVMNVTITKTTEKGPGYWKLNCSLLKDDNYKKEIEAIIDETIQNQQDIFLHWEMIKMQVRGHTIKYATRKKHSNYNKIKLLEKKLKEIEQQQATELTLFRDYETQKWLIQKDLNELYISKTKGAMVRARANWIEFGEKPTSYFFNLEKSNAKRKDITKLRRVNGVEIEAKELILDELYQFYSDLYTEKNTVTIEEDYLDNIQIPQVKHEDQLMLNALPTLDEMEIAVKQLNQEKCPGLDGLPIEFVSTFYNKLKYTLHSVYIKSIETNKLPNSTTNGVIALMEKIDRDPLLLTNWRPLTMLNTDYKIYAKILANRLQYVQDYLITNDQTGYIKNRNITTNLTELSTIIDYCHKTQKEIIIMAVDFAKAFDSINWQALQNILYKFGFKTPFVKMVMLCFHNFKVSVMNAGYTTKPLYFQKGTKQGCPISALIFVQIIEIIGLKLKQNPDIKPVDIQGYKKLLSQFADDLWTANRTK